MNSIQLAQKLAFKIKEHGGEAYFVGGYVRDKLLNRETTDIDIEVHGIMPEVLRKILKENVSFSEFGKSFGIFSIDGFNIDIALVRTEKETGEGHRDVDVSISPFIGTFEAAKRRDFTINSMMQNILTGEIIDHFGGKEDLKNKIIRHVNDDTFSRDPLRILRAAQFAARLEFEICEDTISLSKGVNLTALSKERIYEETKKALIKTNKPSIFFESLKKMNHIEPIYRELSLKDKNWKKTMTSLDNAVKYRSLTVNPTAFMLLCLCFYTENAENLVSRLFPNKEIKKYVSEMMPIIKRAYTAAQKQENEYITNELFDSALDKKSVICSIKSIFDSEEEISIFLEERLDNYSKLFSDGKISGRDLINSGLNPSEAFGKILKRAHILQLKGYSKKEALDVVLYENL